jgi:peptidoglycan L-alanyl-D-glutamate endopeptidase CwlK
MPSFGSRSRAHLDSCRFEIVNICEIVIQDYDFTVLCGSRTEEEQNEAFATGHSKLRFPKSKHNARREYEDGSVVYESLAVDIAPWHPQSPHIRWSNEREFVFLSGLMLQAARSIGLRLRWGGNWDQDQDLYDLNRPFDLVHFELV